MESTFLGIEIGKRSLVANTQGLATIGHNLSNASTDGYSRERVELEPAEPLYMPDMTREETPGQIGEGVEIASVRRIHDQILEGRIVSQANGEGYWDTRDQYLLMVEQVYNEPTDLSVRSLMDKFWTSFQELSVNPDQMSAREAVVQRSQALMDGIHQRYTSLKDIRDMLEQDIEASVKQINDKMSQIADLNKQIVRVKAMGDNPNDLLDRRDLLVKQLAGYMNITVDNRDPDEFNVHTDGFQLIQGGVVHYLSATPDVQNEGYSTVTWADTKESVQLDGGKLASLVQLRDGDVKQEVQKLDNMTMNFADLVNEIHAKGYGLNGKTGVDFFKEYPFVNNPQGNYDRNGDGAFDSTYVFRITGTNGLTPKEQIGLSGTITLSGPKGNIAVDYHPTDTVDDVVKRIDNAGADVVAYLDRENKLTLKATPAENENNPDFVIRHIEDSGQFLVGYAGILGQSGAAGAYDWGHANAVTALRGQGGQGGQGAQAAAGQAAQFAVAPLTHPSGWIELNPVIAQDPESIAAGLGQNGQPAEPGDGSAALAIAKLRTEQVMIGKRTSFDEFFSDAVADIGLKGQTAKQTLDTQKAIMKDLQDQKQAISGVNIDEELANMIKFQHGYAAAARFITEVNQMLDTLINRTGV